MLDKDVSILTQVAFKGAVEATDAYDIASEEGQAYFEGVFSYLTESLITAVKAAVAEHATATNIPKGASTPPRSAAQAIKDELGGTELPFAVTVKGTQHGPLPAWFVKEAESRGTTSVWDNRDQLAENNKRPWFRDTEDKDNCFWPPRAGAKKSGGAKRAPATTAADALYGTEDEPF